MGTLAHELRCAENTTTTAMYLLHAAGGAS